MTLSKLSMTLRNENKPEPTQDEIAAMWGVPRYEAIIWWCGDDVCDCYQPQIELLTPNLTVGRPWMRRTRVWEGAFYSDPDIEEFEEMRAQLAEACADRGIPKGLSIAHDVSSDRVQKIDDDEMARANAMKASLP